MRNMMRTLPVLVILIAVFLSVSYSAANEVTDTHYLEYSVSGQLITVASAVTPYDANPKARDAFLYWFKRGFETALIGISPLMIEWKDSPEGKAGQRGYDFGMDEAERYLKKKKDSNRSLQTTPIPPY
jgi:hypothetical protein